MRKPWVYKRKNIRGWWSRCYASGKRKATVFPRKNLAEHLRRIEYTQLNWDVFTGVVDFDRHDMVSEYRRGKQVKGLMEVSIYEVMLTLGHLKRSVGPESSKAITPTALDPFVVDRGREVSRTTLNKDICHLSAFLNGAA